MNDPRPYFFVLLPRKEEWGYVAKNQKENELTPNFLKLEIWNTLSGKGYSLYRVVYTQEKAMADIQKKKENRVGRTQGPILYVIKNEQNKMISDVIRRSTHFPKIVDFTSSEMSANTILKCDCSFNDIRKTFEQLHKETIQSNLAKDCIRNKDDFWHVLSKR